MHKFSQSRLSIFSCVRFQPNFLYSSFLYYIKLVDLVAAFRGNYGFWDRFECLLRVRWCVGCQICARNTDPFNSSWCHNIVASLPEVFSGHNFAHKWLELLGFLEDLFWCIKILLSFLFLYKIGGGKNVYFWVRVISEYVGLQVSKINLNPPRSFWGYFLSKSQ